MSFAKIEPPQVLAFSRSFLKESRDRLQNRRTLLAYVCRATPSPVQSGHFGQIFMKANREAGLDQIRFHDNRREAATTMAPTLSNVLELAAITGHKSLQMLQINYKPKATDLAARLDA
tara:strand:- start:272 stop:625 length:354 start_codon:yes stop_codon:yes gene_type:complete